MAYTGQPVPSTVYDAARAKVSDGKSVRVAVPESTAVEAGKFYLLGGFLGVAMQSVTTGAGETAEVILNIEPAEFETDQIKATDKASMTAGADIYWDDAAGAKPCLKIVLHKIAPAQYPYHPGGRSCPRK